MVGVFRVPVWVSVLFGFCFAWLGFAASVVIVTDGNRAAAAAAAVAGGRQRTQTTGGQWAGDGGVGTGCDFECTSGSDDLTDERKEQPAGRPTAHARAHTHTLQHQRTHIHQRTGIDWRLQPGQPPSLHRRPIDREPPLLPLSRPGPTEPPPPAAVHHSPSPAATSATNADGSVRQY